MTDSGLPWQRSSIELLDLRQRERVLVLFPGETNLVTAVGGLIGRHGQLFVIEPDRTAAEAIAATHAGPVEVIAMQPEPNEHFGLFDAILACPLLEPFAAAADWGALLGDNLRPGGRFVVDLPAPGFAPLVETALRHAGIATAEAALTGRPEEELAEALRDRGLRRVQTALGTHLLTRQPFELAELFGRALTLARPDIERLAGELVRGMQTTVAGEVLIHRTRVAGIR